MAYLVHQVCSLQADLHSEHVFVVAIVSDPLICMAVEGFEVELVLVQHMLDTFDDVVVKNRLRTCVSRRRGEVRFG